MGNQPTIGRLTEMCRFQQAKSLVAAFLFALSNIAFAQHDYPRTMAIAIGIPIKYDDPTVQKNLSRADILVLGFWPHWKENENKSARKAVQAIKVRNPNILIGQYTVLNEAKATDNPDRTSIDIARKLDREGWWLRGPTGDRIQHTAEYGAWDINITKLTKLDENNQRFPEWLAHRNYNIYFKNIPEFDFWFLDNSGPYSPVRIADWNNNHVPMPSALPSYAKAYREGHRAYWETISTLQPDIMLIGNALDLTSEEYKGQLNGALLEAAMGLSWSIYERQGWDATRLRYYEFIEDTRAPKIVGFNVWGAADDYKKMRFGLTTCLLNNGYFSYTDKKQGYAEMPWFDEYDAVLGLPLEPPPSKAWVNGVWRRSYQFGTVIVNPTHEVKAISLEKEYKKLRGKQDPVVNSGETVRELKLNPEDGLILMSDSYLPAAPDLQVK